MPYPTLGIPETSTKHSGWSTRVVKHCCTSSDYPAIKIEPSNEQNHPFTYLIHHFPALRLRRQRTGANSRLFQTAHPFHLYRNALKTPLSKTACRKIKYGKFVPVPQISWQIPYPPKIYPIFWLAISTPNWPTKSQQRRSPA